MSKLPKVTHLEKEDQGLERTKWSRSQVQDVLMIERVTLVSY
jgi:hypothetical protein